MFICIFIRRKEEDIMYEIMIQGPVQALMQVHTGRSFADNCVLNEKASCG
jgi:hypothetical protein